MVGAFLFCTVKNVTRVLEYLVLSVIVHGTPKKVAVILLSKITAFQWPFFLLKSHNEEEPVSQIDLVFLRTSVLLKSKDADLQ